VPIIQKFPGTWKEVTIKCSHIAFNLHLVCGPFIPFPLQNLRHELKMCRGY